MTAFPFEGNKKTPIPEGTGAIKKLDFSGLFHAGEKMLALPKIQRLELLHLWVVNHTHRHCPHRKAHLRPDFHIV